MSRPAARPLRIAALALALTVASCGVQRFGPTATVQGEGFCPGPGACRVPALGAGFPLPFLVDDPQVSVPNQVSLFEDDFHPAAFVADLAVYLALATLASRWLRRRRATAAP